MTATEARPEATTRKTGYMHGLDLLRVIGSCAVVLTHLTAWYGLKDPGFWVVTAVQEGVVGTLHLNDHLHFFGVAVFLVVSGVVVTHVADRESPGQFLRRRVVRLIPLLWAATLLGWLAIKFGLYRTSADPAALGFGDLAANLVLGGFFLSPPVVVLGVTWTLLIQIGFYAYVAATIPVLRRLPWAAPLAAAPLCFVVVLATFDVSVPGLSQVGSLIGYLPLLCLGQLVSLVHSRKIAPLTGIAIGVAHFAVVVWVDKLYRYSGMGEAVPRTLLFGVLLTVLLVSMDGPVCRSPFVRGWAKRTYAVYLVHIPAMYPLLGLLTPLVGPTLATVAGLAAVAAVTEVLHRFVEVPADRAIRRWERRKRERRSD
ncbi:acyltransferase family protein [Saccharothrix obliqua]|uniref:acyltransferase family protein n=1 Tax=Saccharothrix obliqua TaxID=2861747 RepID=UPI001C5DE536|nr:acyltransferase [Saccharothrix obliqua]MBW4719534.1 acyltransferase [Saccharothrix obliqua]